MGERGGAICLRSARARDSYHQLNLVFSFLEPDLLALPDQVFPQLPHVNSLPTVLTFLLPQVGHLFFLAISTPTFARARL